MKRPGWLQRRTELRRKTPINPINRERRDRMRGGPPGSPDRHTYGPYHGWVGTLECVLLTAHRSALEERARLGRKEARRDASGQALDPADVAQVAELEWLIANLEAHECAPYPKDGAAVKGHHVKTVRSGGRDFANEVPACYRAHRRFHDWPASQVHAHYGVDLKLWAETLAREYPYAA